MVVRYFTTGPTTSGPASDIPDPTHANHDMTSENREADSAPSVPSGDQQSDLTYRRHDTSSKDSGRKVTLLYFADSESGADLKPLALGHPTEDCRVIKPIIRLHCWGTLVGSVLSRWTKDFLSKGPTEVEQTIRRRYNDYHAKDNFEVDFAHDRAGYLRRIGPVPVDTNEDFPFTLTMKAYKEKVLSMWNEVVVGDPSSVNQPITGPRLVTVDLFGDDITPTSGGSLPSPTTCTYAIQVVDRDVQPRNGRYARVHLK
uniref:Uncharacterized protein n=1 Tax=Kwoniella bestiolae CBS 10118 TaxID=1296100 RepID=A0A1B9G9M8_9TREE|nr:hypothetical protein I302_02564 [Kwoniella bestiolae CBS 10118]OCF27719.1 hypothetical protein I302_02564 [Kwoniella bestiolae CBS 10118]